MRCDGDVSAESARRLARGANHAQIHVCRDCFDLGHTLLQLLKVLVQERERHRKIER